MNLKTLTLLLIFPFCVSCVHRNDNVIVVDEHRLNCHVLHELQTYGDIALKPSKLIVVDSILVILDNTKDDQLKFFNTSSGKTYSFVSQGRGKGEVLGAFDIDYWRMANAVALLDITDSKLLMCSFDSISLASYYPSQTYDLKATGYPHVTNVAISDSTLYAGGFFDDVRFFLYDLHNAEISDKVSVSPCVDDEHFDRFVNQAYMGTMHYEPSVNKVVIGCRYADQLEIYDMSDGGVVYVKGPEMFEPEYQLVNTAHVPSLAHSPNERKGYICMTADDDYIYALYSGRSMQEEKSAYGKEIRKFTWGGEYVASFVSDRDILSFDIRDDGVFFAISDAGEIFSLEAH